MTSAVSKVMPASACSRVENASPYTVRTAAGDTPGQWASARCRLPVTNCCEISFTGKDAAWNDRSTPRDSKPANPALTSASAIPSPATRTVLKIPVAIPACSTGTTLIASPSIKPQGKPMPKPMRNKGAAIATMPAPGAH